VKVVNSPVEIVENEEKAITVIMGILDGVI